MSSLRRSLACLLMLLVPLSAWAGQVHCFKIGASLPALGALHPAHALVDVQAHGDRDVGVMASDVASAAHSAHHHAPHKDKAAASADHSAPCCGAVLPAPTFHNTAGAIPRTNFPELGARFDSLPPAPLKRPPRTHTA